MPATVGGSHTYPSLAQHPLPATPTRLPFLSRFVWFLPRKQNYRSHPRAESPRQLPNRFASRLFFPSPRTKPIEISHHQVVHLDPMEKGHAHPPVAAPEPPKAQDGGDVENPASAPEVASVVRRWRVADMMERGSLALRALACIFSALAFVVMVSNRHGWRDDWRNFDKYEEYRYLVAISILVFLYSAAQLARRILPASGNAKDLWSKRTTAIVSFVGDQAAAYLMLSAMSAAVPQTNRFREGADNIFTDAAAAAIAMAFLGFATLAASAVISGYKLAKQTYI